MTSNLNRRTVLAAIPATALLHRHVATAGDHPDAELLAHGRQFDAIAERLNAEYARLREMERLFEARQPAWPDALYVRPSDDGLGLRPFRASVGDEIDRAFIAKLRGERRMQEASVPIYPFDKTPPHPKAGQPIPAGEPIGEFPRDHHIWRKAVAWPEAQERAEEIVTGFDRHEAERAALRQELGLTAGEEGAERLEEALEPITDAIAETPATALDGFRVKARAAFWHERNCLGDDMAEDAFGGGSGGEMAVAIVRDLLAGEAV